MTDLLHADELGGGPDTIVFLHGFGACGAVWHEIASVLALSARTLSYDLPGHGASLDFPGAGPAKVAALAVLGDLSTRGIGKVHVVGHSMGSAVAVLMALSAPGRVASLTLLAPGGLGEAINGPLLRRYAAAAENVEIRACLAAMSGPDSSISAAAVDLYTAMRQRPGQTQKLVEIAAAITRDDRQGVIPPERLAALEMPVAVAWGTADPVLPVAHGEHLPSDFRLRLLPGAGHMLMGEAPDAILDLIRQNIGLQAGPIGSA